MSLTTLQGLLGSRLYDFATENGLSVAWEGVEFQPEQDAAYLRPVLLPSEPRAAAVGATAADYIRGIYQIDVLGPAGNGWGEVYGIADELRAYFNRGLSLTGDDSALTVEKSAPGPAIVEDSRFKVIVEVIFHAYMEAV